MRDRGRGRAEAVRARFFPEEEEERAGPRDRAEDRQGPQRPDPRRTEFAQGRPVHHRAADYEYERSSECIVRSSEWRPYAIGSILFYLRTLNSELRTELRGFILDTASTILIVILALYLIFKFFGYLSRLGIKQLSPKELDQKKGMVLLDVRTDKEYEQGHIPGAVHIPLSEIGDKIKKLKKDKELVVF